MPIAIAPPAPGRFSITSACPNCFSTLGCTMRAIASELPPAGKPTTRRIARSGYTLAAELLVTPAHWQTSMIAINAFGALPMTLCLLTEACMSAQQDYLFRTGCKKASGQSTVNDDVERA